jgi:hypothetical protein
MFLEEVEIVPGVFDQLLLSGGYRIPSVQGIVQSINDCFLSCFDLLQQLRWVQFSHSIVVNRLPVAILCHSVLISITYRVKWRGFWGGSIAQLV